ncbi:MAG: ParB/RepB/Spo0J family partition protein [Eubacteriales bacterium]|nr:ParB/RepB/Spo0J family partition protein [Eubacteriales bacterium]
MAEKKTSKSALGKGIGALLDKVQIDEQLIQKAHESVIDIDLGDINPNREQPRKHFDEAALADLAESIAENGIIQPIIVTKRGEANYQIIAGERRWRAARLAGLTKIPSIVRELSSDEILTVALIENIQREDLNPIERAEAFLTIQKNEKLSQDELAKKIGKSRSAVANTMRLLKLPDEVIEEIARGEISEGHGRALLGLDDPEAILDLKNKILENSLSVRETEAAVQDYLRPKPVKQSSKAEPEESELRAISLRRIEQIIRDSLKTKVRIKDRAGKGVIQLHYNSDADLEEILKRLDLHSKL